MDENIRFEEWPEDSEGRLRLVASVANKVLKESSYRAERGVTKGEKCVNIYPKGKENNARNRIAAVWALETRVAHVLVKEPVYEMIQSKVAAKGIKDAIKKEKDSEYTYSYISPETALIILNIIANTER